MIEQGVLNSITWKVALSFCVLRIIDNNCINPNTKKPHTKKKKTNKKKDNKNMQRVRFMIVELPFYWTIVSVLVFHFNVYIHLFCDIILIEVIVGLFWTNIYTSAQILNVVCFVLYISLILCPNSKEVIFRCLLIFSHNIKAFPPIKIYL